MKITSYVCFMLGVLAPLYASGDYNEKVELFRQALLAGDPAGGVDRVFGTGGEAEDQISKDIKNIKEQLVQQQKGLGKLERFERIGECGIADSLVHVTYLAIYEKGFLRFEFQYFKRDSGWTIYSMNFDSDVAAELQHVARLKYTWKNTVADTKASPVNPAEGTP